MADITSTAWEELAVRGGPPVRTTPMPPRLALGADEQRMIEACIDYYRERQVDPGYQGHFEQRYCEAFVRFMGGGYADAVATGTIAVFVAIAALGLPEGSEVLVSPITDPGTLAAIILNRLKPRLCDAKPENYNVGVEQVRARLSPETKAIVVVHSAGQAVSDIGEIVAEAHRRGVRVVEDCSQAHGARCAGELVGRFGDIAAFSTMYRKAHMTGASGGIVYTRDEELYHMALAHADRGKPRWTKGFDDRNPSTFLFPALNLHTDEISCAIGLASLARLSDTISRRYAFLRALSDRMAQVSQICRPYGCTVEDSPFFYPVLVDTGRLKCPKTEFSNALLAEGIGLNPHYMYLVADWPYLKPYLVDGFSTPNARAVRDASFCLYVNENYGRQEVDDTIAALQKVEHFLGR
jgi:perosamine synthetase